MAAENGTTCTRWLDLIEKMDKREAAVLKMSLRPGDAKPKTVSRSLERCLG